MSTLCLLEVSQIRTKAVDGRGALQTKIKTRNKSNDYFQSLQYRQDVRHTAHYHKRKHFYPLLQQKKSRLPIHVAQKITVIRAQKIGKFAV